MEEKSVNITEEECYGILRRIPFEEVFKIVIDSVNVDIVLRNNGWLLEEFLHEEQEYYK